VRHNVAQSSGLQLGLRAGEFRAGDLNLPEGDDPIAIGKLAGWAGAGDQAAQAAIDDMDGRAGQLARALSESLAEQPA